MKTARVSRRRFLQGGAAIAGALALHTITKPGPASASAEDFPGNPDRFAVLTDTTMCIGCRLCEAACNKANGLPEPEVPFSDQSVFEVKRRPDSHALTVVNRYEVPDWEQTVFRKVQCMHCNEPACVSACLVGALKKTPEGAVLYNEGLCIGCRYCMSACPFTMLAYEYDDPLTPAIRKCLMCHQRLVEGEAPACATACPTKATIFGKRAELLDIARERIRQSPDKYVNHIYGEKEAGGGSWLYLASVPFDQLGLPNDLGTTPIPELTRDWLLGVPLVITIWPALLMGVRYLVNHRQSSPEGEEAGEKKTEVTR